MMYIHVEPIVHAEGSMHMEAILRTWGNSRALRIPSAACAILGIEEGARAEMQIDESARSVTFRFKDDEPKRYTRTQKLSLEQVMEGWAGPKLGEEPVGEDVGAEVVA